MDEEERKEWSIFCKPAKHLTAMIMNEQHKEILNNLGLDKAFAKIGEEPEFDAIGRIKNV